MKEEVRSYEHHSSNLTEESMKRYRDLVILIHHFNMFILLPKIFPAKYDPAVDYDTSKF